MVKKYILLIIYIVILPIFFSCDETIDISFCNCSNNSDCGDFEVCVEGECRSKGCITDYDCPSKYSCTIDQNGVGKCEYSESCETNRDCLNGYRCDLDIGLCVSLCEEAGCEQWESCEIDQNKAFCRLKEGRCNSDIDCQSNNICSDQHLCEAGCNDDSNCLDWMYCSEEGECISKCEEEICGDSLDNNCDGEIDENCGSNCSTSSDCPTGEFCFEGSCYQERCGCNGVDYDPVCGADGNIYSNSCTAECLNIEIVNDDLCITNGQNGIECSKNSDCLEREICIFEPLLWSGRCIDYESVDTHYSSSCFFNDDCGDNLNCYHFINFETGESDSGVCLPKSCETDQDCSNGYICDQEKNICSPDR